VLLSKRGREARCGPRHRQAAGGGLDPRGVRRVVAVGMGDQNMRHGLAAHGVQQRPGVRLVIGAGSMIATLPWPTM
jgi:hypothetical protein